MAIEIFIKLCMSILLVASMVILNFVMFRISIKNNHRQIAILSLVVGATLFYFKFIANSPALMFIMTFIYIIMIIILRRYPFLYALIVGIFASLFVTIADTIVTAPSLSLGLSTYEQMKDNIGHYIFFHLATSFIMLLTAYILYKLNIGFWFVKTRFQGQIKVSDIIWSVILVIVLLIIHFTSTNIQEVSHHGIILTLLVLGLIILLCHAYKQNEKVKKDRFPKGE